ncbi:energy transducer TonB [Acidicapsa ligni]|uniref:energy transducer TonB n=1 Tax=Acidicapsa ligni TaxID=542300 RepID=UPI0021E023D2|nr:energy transducer TonB [Acidicapsa ligni]
MQTNSYAGRARFGLLPEPERNPASIVTSFIINGAILILLLVFGTVAHHELEARKLEKTEIVFPTTPPPEIKVKIPPPPKMPAPPKPQIVKLEPPKIIMPKLEAKPDVKLPMVKEAVNLPKVAAAKPAVVLAPQPKAALSAAAAPALTPQQHPSTQPVHFGDLNGVTPNPNANKPATVAALGNPYGGSQGKAEAPRGVVGSTGFGNGTRSGSSAGTMGKVASAGLPGGTGTASNGGSGSQGKVASAGIPGLSAASNTPAAAAVAEAKTTPPVLLSHAAPQYTDEARQLKIQGDVVLRVTITTTGQMLVHNVIRGLGHGLDEAATRSATSYKFQPATKNGQPVDYTTNIIIKFQTA